MPSDSNKDLPLWLSPAPMVRTAGAAWLLQLGEFLIFVGSKRKLIPMRNGFGVGKSRKLKQLGCLEWSWEKETLCLDKLSPPTSGYKTHLNFFPKNLTVVVVE